MKKTIGLMAALSVATLMIAHAAEEQVSRLPRVPVPPTDPIVKQMFDETKARGGQILNLHLTMGNAPKLAKAEQDLTYSLRFEAKSPRALRELAIVRTAEMLHAAYEMHQHAPLLLACGFTQAQVDGIATWRTNKLFGDKESALLAYVEEMDRGGDVSDATFAGMKKHFTPEEILEITIVTAHYYGTALLTKSLQIKVENDDRKPAPGKC